MVELSKAFGKIEDAYDESGRHYHNMIHVQDLFGKISELPIANNQKEILYHVALFHDVIYRKGASSNEKRSANYASEVLLDLGLEPEKIEHIHQIILSTACHSSKDSLAQYFNDLDLSILAENPRKYNRYIEKIRLEHASVSICVFRYFRSRFLKSMLKRKFIFATQYCRGRYEEKARQNIEYELRKMSRKLWKSEI